MGIDATPGVRRFVSSIALGVAAFVILMPSASVVQAHPVPKNSRDRTIVVKILPGAKADEVRIRIHYLLQVDPAAFIIEDVADIVRDEGISFKDKLLAEMYAECARLFAPVLVGRLDTRVGGREVPLVCVQATATEFDPKGKSLDHLECNFFFEGTAAVVADQETQLRFREGNFDFYDGKIDLSFVDDGAIKIISKEEPSAELKTKAGPGESEKLRLLKVRFVLPAQASPAPAEPTPPADAPPSANRAQNGLLQFLFDSREGLLLMIFFSFWFGAAHALTPGHGKTLVAAYLVGQNGTVGHALILGLVTTFTHTSVVFLLAGILMVLPFGIRAQIQSSLELFVGLMIVCLGFYLLLQRLSGGADHIHIGGSHHHHGSGHHHHAPISPGQVSAWGLVTLGISGGLVPCWDAVAMLMFAVRVNLLELAIPLLLAFSAGLAATLVVIGILVVKVRRFANSRMGDGRIVRALPMVSAVFILAMGFLLCYESVNSGELSTLDGPQ